VWRNFFEDAGLVQFMHRMTGYVVLAFGLFVWSRGRASAHPRTRRAFDWVAMVLVGQVVLGIVTVLTQAQWHVAIAHQLVAVVLWVLILRARYLSGYPVASSIRTGR
jgi:cytochrome c oxidase assembly protein subunit 15